MNKSAMPTGIRQSASAIEQWRRWVLNNAVAEASVAIMLISVLGVAGILAMIVFVPISAGFAQGTFLRGYVSREIHKTWIVTTAMSGIVGAFFGVFALSLEASIGVVLSVILGVAIFGTTIGISQGFIIQGYIGPPTSRVRGSLKWVSANILGSIAGMIIFMIFPRPDWGPPVVSLLIPGDRSDDLAISIGLHVGYIISWTLALFVYNAFLGLVLVDLLKKTARIDIDTRSVPLRVYRIRSIEHGPNDLRMRPQLAGAKRSRAQRLLSGDYRDDKR